MFSALSTTNPQTWASSEFSSGCAVTADDFKIVIQQKDEQFHVYYRFQRFSSVRSRKDNKTVTENEGEGLGDDNNNDEAFEEEDSSMHFLRSGSLFMRNQSANHITDQSLDG